jgi:serine/threonine protein kinase
MKEVNNLKVLWGHRNLVTIYGITQSHDWGCLCIVMDLVCGCNLNSFLHSCGTIAFEHLDKKSESTCKLWRLNDVSWWMDKLRLFKVIIIGLVVCQREQVYDEDLKGTNILFDKSFVPTMVDFGMSLMWMITWCSIHQRTWSWMKRRIY